MAVIIPHAKSAPVSTPLLDSTLVHPEVTCQPIMLNTIPLIQVQLPIPVSPPGPLELTPPHPTISTDNWSTLLSKIKSGGVPSLVLLPPQPNEAAPSTNVTVMSHNTHVTFSDKLQLVLSHGPHYFHFHMTSEIPRTLFLCSNLEVINS